MTDSGVNLAAQLLILKFTTEQFRSHSGNDSQETLITLCILCHGSLNH